ncbi:TetR/AcrR family transcriptional regulator [Actinomadura sp. DC4]|uniref:TetR/AcrR family transcriptional regulator n=1 Tax=Actinomadura sp. DC4 TaxID=3055069 RepID=UPI0025B1BEB7|nr:TetR/AcrR family transcriptional regulator [Actinomadura sp. DC4]MDN3351712.1 TetR/AcrR family transcriptional regulator [Actinomadura sp. DC4]
MAAESGARRPHTGRRRNPAVRQAVLDAAADLLASADGPAISVDAIARRAGVSKHTIYRWWPSKGAVLLEAMVEQARREAAVPDTGVLSADLEGFLTVTFAAVERNGPLLRTAMAESLRDDDAAEGLRAFAAARRAELHGLLERGRSRGELPEDADLGLMVDQMYGLLWYRLLIGHAPLNAETAARLARSLPGGRPAE